jgi:hypothetical protein
MVSGARRAPWPNVEVSARELALDRERWVVRARCERGSTEQLPDLAVWLDASKAPAAVIAESGGRREDRQKMILEGWRDALWSGRYVVVRYDCASASVAHWIARLARKVGLTDSEFTAVVQTTAEQIAALSPAVAIDEPPVEEMKPAADTAPGDGQYELVEIQRPPGSALPSVARRDPPPTPPPVTTPQQAAEREHRYREILGIPEPKTRRKWRR